MLHLLCDPRRDVVDDHVVEGEPEAFFLAVIDAGDVSSWASLLEKCAINSPLLSPQWWEQCQLDCCVVVGALISVDFERHPM